LAIGYRLSAIREAPFAERHSHSDLHICYLLFQCPLKMREADESLPLGKWAYGLMLGFVISLLGISWAVAMDWQNRHETERISQPTAVGDPITVVFDPRQDQTKEVVRWKGAPYYPVRSGVTSLPEYNAFKLGVDDSGKTWLYRPKHEPKENEIIVKIGANQFLRLSPSHPQ
jgi:hypothetical protein